jgi:hypothetical protein
VAEGDSRAYEARIALQSLEAQATTLYLSTQVPKLPHFLRELLQRAVVAEKEQEPEA